jgi:hypothetical protein
VDVASFATTSSDRVSARKELGIEDDELVVLWVGRLSYHAKAHPEAMYIACESVASDKPITLLQCGWFANEAIESAYRSSAAAVAPRVKAVFTDGTDERQRRLSWAAADVFCSLADNIQETFGLTPLEAMASGLPVLVTDWDGYRETVRDGIDGFRVTTLMPGAGLGEPLALAYEAGSITYDQYCGFSCLHVALDIPQLIDRLRALATSSELRSKMGEAGRRRALESYDWQVIYGRYEELWRELAARRTFLSSHDNKRRAPRGSLGREDPFRSFAHYATEHIDPKTCVVGIKRGDGRCYDELVVSPIYNFASKRLPSTSKVDAFLNAAAHPISLTEIKGFVGIQTEEAVLMAATLCKMGLLQIVGGSSSGDTSIKSHEA